MAPSALHGQEGMLQPPASVLPTSGSPPSPEAVMCQSFPTSGQMDKKQGVREEGQEQIHLPTGFVNSGAFGLLFAVFLQHGGDLHLTYIHKQRWGVLEVQGCTPKKPM